MAKSTRQVVPPKAAAVVPVSKSSVEVVPPEAGVRSTDPERLHDGLRTLVHDRAAAAAAGRAARAAALARFGVPRFLADWDRTLASVVRVTEMEVA